MQRLFDKVLQIGPDPARVAPITYFDHSGRNCRIGASPRPVDRIWLGGGRVGATLAIACGRANPWTTAGRVRRLVSWRGYFSFPVLFSDEILPRLRRRRHPQNTRGR